MMKHVVVGTAGHIDHGKSSLVRALTGIDPDRLKEEKERGITIDLGFAYLKNEGGLSLAFVDVPGHERFVKNMLAGVGGIDLVMLVVAADESVMPQSREHFEICRLLKIRGGLIALTKCDLVEPEIREIAAMETRELVAGSFLESAPIVQVSTRTGEGMEELKNALVRLARAAPSRSDAGRFRLPVDRVFSMKGFGTVVTGTIRSGSIGLDDEVEILPPGLEVRVRGIQVHGDRQFRASAGQRAALNLPGVEVSDIARGDALVERGWFRPTSMLDCDLEVLAGSPIPMKDLTRVHLHLATAQVLARVRLLGGVKAIAPGESGLAQLRLESPIVAAPGDRFILRRYSPLETIAGGIVLDAYPQKHSTSSRSALEGLMALRGADALSLAARFIDETGASGISEVALGRRLGVGAVELEQVLGTLLKDKKAALVSKSPQPERSASEASRGARAVGVGPHGTERSPRVVVAPAVVDEVGKKVEDLLRAFQRKSPLLGGMPKSELLEKAASGAPAEVFDLILGKLEEAKRLRVAKDLVSTFDHRISLSEDESRARDLLVDRYQKAGVRPQSLSEIAAEAKLDPKLLERVQRVLLKDGTLVQISEGMVFHRDSLSRLKERVRSCKSTRERIDVAFFKEMAGVTRKHAIPLLEWLDRERVTERSGNERVIL
jgi:selenocysteine-specific elongation factor